MEAAPIKQSIEVDLDSLTFVTADVVAGSVTEVDGGREECARRLKASRVGIGNAVGIPSRTPTMEAAVYDGAMACLQAVGSDPTRLVKTPQPPAPPAP